MTILGNDELLLVPEVATRLKVSKTRVYQMLSTGELKGFKNAHSQYASWRVRSSVLEAYIRELEGR